MKPITREEMYLAAAAGYDVTPPEPVTRKEKFLAKLAGMEVETPTVFTRQERLLDEAAVALSRSVIEPLEITENGTYTAPDGVDGYSPVTVAVPDPEINLQDKTITENGTYTADSGYDGLGMVTVDVKGGGGGLPAGVYWSNDIDKMTVPTATTGQIYCTLNGNLYAITHMGSSYKNNLYIYKYENGAWEQKFSHSCGGNVNWLYICPFEYNGKIHFVGLYSQLDHFAFDDSGKVVYNTIPTAPSDAGRCNTFVDGGKLKYSVNNGTVYVWDETTDTWTEEVALGAYGYRFFNYNEDAFCYYNKKIYKYKNGTRTQFCTVTPSDLTTRVLVIGDFAYINLANASQGNAIYKINMKTGVETLVCRTPPLVFIANYYDWVYYEDKIHFMGYNGSVKMHLTMHEVTE